MDLLPWCQLLWKLITLQLRQNGRHFPDAIFTCILVNDKFCILIAAWLEFVPKIPINNIPALVQIMALRRQATGNYLNQCWPGLLTHICVTRPHWVNQDPFTWHINDYIKQIEPNIQNIVLKLTYTIPFFICQVFDFWPILALFVSIESKQENTVTNTCTIIVPC